MVEAQRQGCDPAGNDLVVVAHPRTLVDRANGENASFARIEDRGAGVDAEHTDVGDRERAADTKRLRAIAREINDLANRARNRKLSPDEISGGTFTITNNGSSGSVLTMAIINQPQVAILSTDAIRKRPVVVTTAEGDFIAARTTGILGQSFDHRAFDGAYAASFLSRLKQVIETHTWSTEISGH